MPRPSARARGYMEAGNHGKRVPLPQKHQCFHPPRGPPQARKTARSRCCRIARLTAAPPASAATLLAPASRAQPPITAPNQDLRRGSSGVEKVLLGQQGARRASAGCAMGRGGAPGVGGGPGAAGAGRQRAHLHISAPRSASETQHRDVGKCPPASRRGAPRSGRRERRRAPRWSTRPGAARRGRGCRACARRRVPAQVC